jgi:hypothetical protein
MLDELFSQLLGRAAAEVRTNDPVVNGLVRWMGKLQENAFFKWRAVAASGIACARQVKTVYGTVAACPSAAVAACALCKQPTCIDHACIASTGAVACTRCMNVFADVVRERVGAPPSPRVEGAPPRPRMPVMPADEEAALRKKHLRMLGLKDPSDMDEIRVAFKTLMAKHHPDRQPEGAKRDAATKKCAAISAAFAWLKEQDERQAAA